MSDVSDVREVEADRAVHRLLRSFGSVDSYGLVLLMILLTYVLAVSVTPHWGASIAVVVQVGTVRLALRTSQTHRPMRIASDVIGIVAVGVGGGQRVRRRRRTHPARGCSS